MAEANWYVVHTYSGYENKVKVDIEKTIENRNLQDQILEVSVPMQEVIEVKNGANKQVAKKMFPGYVLINLDSSTCPASTGKVVYNQLSVNHFCKTSFPPPSTSLRRPPRLLPSNCKNHQIRSSSIFYHALSRSSYRPLLNMQNNNSTIDRFRRPPKHLMAIASFHLSRFPSSGVGF